MALEQTVTLFFGTGLGAAAVLVFVRPRQVTPNSIQSAGSFRDAQTAHFTESADGLDTPSSVKLESEAVAPKQIGELSIPRTGPFSMEASFKAHTASPSEARAARSRLPPALKPSHGIRWTRRFTGTDDSRKSDARLEKRDVYPQTVGSRQEP